MRTVRNLSPVELYDRVKTRSGRHGVVMGTTGKDVAHVQWDDGEEFPIKFCHLEVLAHGCKPVLLTRRFVKG